MIASFTYLFFSRPFLDKHLGEEVEGSCLGDEYKGYVFRISGGNDKQGFPMKQGILKSERVRVLLKKGFFYYILITQTLPKHLI